MRWRTATTPWTITATGRRSTPIAQERNVVTMAVAVPAAPARMATTATIPSTANYHASSSAVGRSVERTVAAGCVALVPFTTFA